MLTAWRGGLLRSRRVSMHFRCADHCDSHCSLRGRMFFYVCWWGEGNSWLVTEKGRFLWTAQNSGSLFTISTEWPQQEYGMRAVLRAKAAPESTVCVFAMLFMHIYDRNIAMQMAKAFSRNVFLTVDFYFILFCYRIYSESTSLFVVRLHP